MNYTENQLIKMASPISSTEEEKCKNAIRMVSDALSILNYRDDGNGIRFFEEDTYSFVTKLHNSRLNRDITILVQGSYANKTNIRQESDVDVAAILESTFITKYREGISDANYGFREGDYNISTFKDEVEGALRTYFSKGVERHDKSIRVSGNSYRVDADVVPAYRYRDYSQDFLLKATNYVGGIEIRPDSGGRIINYPEQHIRLGRKKNTETSYYYKKMVRIMKSLKEDMLENRKSLPASISSFGIESLLWNVPNKEYVQYTSMGLCFSNVLVKLRADLVN